MLPPAGPLFSLDYVKNEPSCNSLVMFTHLTLNRCLFEDPLSAEHPIFSFSNITAFSSSQVPQHLESYFCPRFLRSTWCTVSIDHLWVLPPLLYRALLTTHMRLKITQLTFFKTKFDEHLTLSRAHLQSTDL